MPESDNAEIRRRRNELGCPQTFGEISHIPRGDGDSATTFGGVLDPLRGVIGCATFAHRIGQRLQSHAVTKFGCGEIRRSGNSTSAAVSALSSRVKATLIVSTFPFSGRSLPGHGTPLRRLSPEGHRLALSPAFFQRGRRERAWISEASSGQNGRNPREGIARSAASSRAHGEKVLALLCAFQAPAKSGCPSLGWRERSRSRVGAYAN